MVGVYGEPKVIYKDTLEPFKDLKVSFNRKYFAVVNRANATTVFQSDTTEEIQDIKTSNWQRIIDFSLNN